MGIVHKQMKGRNWTLCGRYIDKNGTITVAENNLEITCKACGSQVDEQTDTEK